MKTARKPLGSAVALALTMAAASCERGLAGAPCPCLDASYVCCNDVCERAAETSCTPSVAASGGEASDGNGVGASGSGAGSGANGSPEPIGGQNSGTSAGSGGIGGGGDTDRVASGTAGLAARGGTDAGPEPDGASGAADLTGSAGTAGTAGNVGSGGSAGNAGAAGTVGGGGSSAVVVPPEYCSRDGWCGGDIWLGSMWGSSPEDMWFLGNAAAHAVVVHGDGQSWTTRRFIDLLGLEDDGGPNFSAIWGSAKDDVWFAGSMLVRYGGGDFSAFPVYDESDVLVPYTSFSALWGSSERDVWAVDNIEEFSRLVHFDGERWKRDPARPQEVLSAIWGSRSNDVWAIGTNGCVLHFDGESWSDCDAGSRPTASSLTAISGTADDDVFVLSEMRSVHHWDGERWGKRDLGTLNAPYPTSLSAAPGKFWLGTPGAIVSGRLSGDLEVIETHADTGLGMSLWRFPTGEMWATGAFGASAYSDGNTWTSFVRPNFGASYFAVWAASSDSLWAVDGDRVLQRQAGTWSTRLDAPISQLITIWGTSDENVWVGGNDVFHWDGRDWHRRNELPMQVSALWGTSVNDVWAAGPNGALWRYDGETFAAVESPTKFNLMSIWGTAPDDVWLTAEVDGPWHFDGQRWSNAALRIGQNWYRPRFITGTSRSDIWFLGWGKSGPDVVHWNGAEWRAFEEPPIWRTQWTPGSAWANAPCQIWLAGTDAEYEEQVAAFDGTSWRLENVGSVEGNSKITGVGGEVWIAAANGVLAHRAADARSLTGFDCTAPAPKHPLACNPNETESFTTPCGDCWTGQLSVSRTCGANGLWGPWSPGLCQRAEPCPDPDPDQPDDGT